MKMLILVFFFGIFKVNARESYDLLHHASIRHNDLQKVKGKENDGGICISFHLPTGNVKSIIMTM